MPVIFLQNVRSSMDAYALIQVQRWKYNYIQYIALEVLLGLTVAVCA